MAEDETAHDGWERVVYAGDVDSCGHCPVCFDVDYADCPCPGPTMDGYEYTVFGGDLYARPVIRGMLE